MRKGLWLGLVLLLIATPISLAQPAYVVANSQDWRDVYSTVLYVNLIGARPFFLVSMRHAPILAKQIAKGSQALIVSSARQPYVLNYASTLNAEGILAEELRVQNANLYLANQLDVENYIIVGDTYGYNAIAVAPYAVQKKAYVLFASRNNINEVVRHLAGKARIGELIIYGVVDRVVMDSLRGFNPIVINNGDRYSDNVAIVKRYLALKPSKQAVLTNGEFIENEIMAGESPVIFIGRGNVPDVIINYVKQSGIEIGVLIGNELVGTATTIRRQLGISVFVKFAQGARTPTGPVSRVEALDMFYLPRVVVLMDITSIVYNAATGMLEVVYQNMRDYNLFFKSTFTITSELGERQVVGDLEPVFLDRNGVKTIAYPVERFQGRNLTGRAVVVYGDARNSLEFLLDKSFSVSTISVMDRAKINITGVFYDIASGEFIIELQNIGEVAAYVDIELIDLKIGYNLVSLGLEEVALLQPGEKRRFRLKPQEPLTPEDLANNKIVKVRVYYGERELALVNVIEGDFELKEIKRNYALYVIVGVAVLLLLWLLLLKLRVKCDNCKHRNLIFRSRCSKCGHPL